MNIIRIYSDYKWLFSFFLLLKTRVNNEVAVFISDRDFRCVYDKRERTMPKVDYSQLDSSKEESSKAAQLHA